MTIAKPIIKIKSAKRFLHNTENQEQQQKIFEIFDIWTIERLIDEVFLLLMSVKSQFCMINARDDPRNQFPGTLRRPYEEQARYKMYRMVVYRPPPAFVIYLKDLDERVRRELAKEDKTTRNDILKRVA